MRDDVHKHILRLYVRHRMRDMLVSDIWTEDALTEAFSEYVKRRPSMRLSRAAELFRRDVLVWLKDRSSKQPKGPMMRYRTVEPEP